MANPIAIPGSNVPSGAAVSPGGAQGVAGSSGTPAVTTTIASFTVPNVGSTTTVTVANASWITVGQMIYVANAAGTALSGALQVTAIAGNTLTLLNPASPPAIPIASSSAAGLMNSLSGNVTDYVGGDNACHPLSLTPTNAFVTKTAAYTLTTSDSGKYIICSGGSWTLTLPVPVAGLIYRLRNDMGISGTTGTITLQPLSGTIDGQASIPLLPQQECTAITDGVNWRTHELKREVILGTQDITTAQASGVVLLPAGYRYFELEFTGYMPSTNNDYLIARLSTDGGTTWIGTGYYDGALYNPTSTTAVGYVEENVSRWELTNSQVAAAGASYTEARAVLYPGSATMCPTFHVNAVSRSASSLTIQWLAGGFLNNLARVNALMYFGGLGGNFTNFLTVKGVV